MTESLGARCHTLSHSGRMVERPGGPAALSAGVLLVFTVMLLFGTMKAQAGLTVRDTNGAQICRFEENGDLYLSGVLVEYGGDTIPSLPAGSDCWRILNSDGSVLLWLFKSEATVGNVTYYPGDMILAGTVSGYTSLTDSSIWRLKDSSGTTVVAQLTPGGNLQLRYGPGQQYVSDKVFTNSSLATSIASDRFQYVPGDLDYLANNGNAHTVRDDTLNPRPTEIYDPDVTDYPYWYDEMESQHTCGDLWVTTWVKNENGKPFLLIANGDGFGLSYRLCTGDSDTYPRAYQRTATGQMVRYPDPGGLAYKKDKSATPNYPSWEALPAVAISKYCGGSSSPAGSLAWPLDSPLNGPGETIARFLRSYDTILPTGDFEDDYEDYDFSTLVIPNSPGGGVYYKNGDNPSVDSHSYRTPRGLKPTGLIHFPTGGSGTTYLACHAHNPNHPDDVEDPVNSDDWAPTAAAQHVYIFKSEDQGETWEPKTTADGPDNLPRLDLHPSTRVWKDYLFTTPVFCQFGMAYEKYQDAFPGESTKYLYAFSPHDRWCNTDNLYLGRAVVYNGSAWVTDNVLTSTNWSYWAGTDSTGQPIWASGADAVSKAAPILHAKGEIGQPSVIYHKDSGLYLMATFSNSGRNTLDGWPSGKVCPDSLASKTVPVGGQKDAHWILWQAPKPWGPWKKVFTNDYNGLHTDFPYASPVADRIGFVGYNVQIMPAWTSTSGAGQWSIWVLPSGFRNFLQVATLPFPEVPTGQPHPFNGEWDWLYNYTMQFSQIALSQKPKPISASLSPMYQHEQNNTPVVPASAITVGYHFQLAEARTVTHLGRYFVTGNSGTHTLKIASVRVIDTTADQPTYVASKTLNLGSFTPDQMDENGFVYVKLDSPVQLSANTHYLLLSTEGGTGADAVFGGQSNWANGVYEVVPPPNPVYALENVVDLPEVSTGRVLQVLDGAIERLPPNTNTWTLLHDGSWSESDLGKTEQETGIYGVPLSGVGGNAYGALNLLFQKEESPKAPWPMHSTTGQTVTIPPALECMVGTRFTMAGDVIVSALARLKVANNAKVHEVRLMLEELEGQTYTYTTIASIPIRMYPGTANGTYVYRDLATPVRLLSGKTYVLVSREFYNVGENYCDKYSMEDSLGSEFDEASAFWVEWTSNGVGDRHVEDDEKCYAGVNLKYQ